MSVRVHLLGAAAALLASASAVPAQELGPRAPAASGTAGPAVREHSLLRSPAIVAHGDGRTVLDTATSPDSPASATRREAAPPDTFSCADRPFLEALFRAAPHGRGDGRSVHAGAGAAHLRLMVRSAITLMKQLHTRAAMLAGLRAGHPAKPDRTKKAHPAKGLLAGSARGLLGGIPAAALRDPARWECGLASPIDGNAAVTSSSVRRSSAAVRGGSSLKPGASWGERVFKRFVKFWTALERLQQASRPQSAGGARPAPRVPYLGL